MMESAEYASEDTTTPFTDVGNKVVPHRKALKYATGNWLGRVDRYFSTFAKRTATGKHRARQSFAVSDMGTLESEYLEDFEVLARLDAQPAEVIVRYNCRGQVRLSRVPNSIDGYFRLRDLLSRHGLDHHSAICGTIAKIQLNPAVPVELRFTADLEDAAIHARFRNVGALGETQYKLAPHECSLDLLHAVEALILGEPSRFQDFTGTVASREQRIELSRRVSAEARRADIEAQRARAHDRAGRARQTWMSRLKRAVGRSH